jgi:uncharacterized membrane protein (DUF4010 family)
MPQNNLFNLPPDSFFTMAWVLTLSTWGGVAGYVRKIKQGMTRRFSITELVGEIVVSSFVGIITYFLCKSSGIDETVTAAIVGVSSHMGSRAIYFLEVVIRKKTGLDVDDRCLTCEVMTGEKIRCRREGDKNEII